MQKKDDVQMRSSMEKMFSERIYSGNIRGTISPLFRNLERAQKEALAKQIIALVEPCESEEEAIQKIREAFHETAG